MKMYISELGIENFRCFGEGNKRLVIELGDGLTTLVGENDTGKTAIVDAIRFALGTRDQEYLRVNDGDFHLPPGSVERRKEICVQCKFDGLTADDKSAFAEYLTYEERNGQTDAVLYINWTARNAAGVRGSRRLVVVEVKSGASGDGPTLDAEARSMLCATYLRPLRDAERALDAGRGSRLSQILQYTKEVKEHGADYDREADAQPDPETLSVLGVGDYASALLEDHEGIKAARKRLNDDYLGPLSFRGDALTGHIGVSVSGEKETRLRQLLEKLELELRGDDAKVSDNRGLGSNNLLFMACELLLLGSETTDFPLLLIEEPEAHLHPQRQLRLMQFLQSQAEAERTDGQKMQIIVTTHSSTLASAVKLDNLVMLQNGKAFSLRAGLTKLDRSDYRFLERFLDVTKANLFFARGVVIVEGDGESILLPTVARLIGHDFAQYGVSIVNVGHTGLRRFARIFQRHDPAKDGILDVPVACIADLDVMPDCAPIITGKVKQGEEWPARNKRRWLAKSDFAEGELAERRDAIASKARGQRVETYVTDEWTLEYDLAYAGLAEDVWIAGWLASKDDSINTGKKNKSDIEAAARRAFEALRQKNLQPEELASNVYALFTKGNQASKAIAAQYLAERLEWRITQGELTPDGLRALLPVYLKSAIEHVSAVPQPEAAPAVAGN